MINLAGIARPAHAVPSEDIRACRSAHRTDHTRLICEHEERDAGTARRYLYSSWRHMEICARDELRAKGLLEP